ncbi:phage holin family protein [Nocardia sp. IFM 10818]
MDVPGTHGAKTSPLSDVAGLGPEQLSALVREQTRRAIGETIGRMPRFGKRAKLMAAAALLALYGGGALVAAAVLVIALAVPAWVAALIIGVVLLVAAAVVRAMAKSRGGPDTGVETGLGDR